MTKPPSSKNIVFYADDDVDDLELVQEAFARFTRNVEVITARDGSQAMNWIQRIGHEDPRPCLIILDINMPFYNGKEILKHIRTIDHLQEVPVVLFTTSWRPGGLGQIPAVHAECGQSCKGGSAPESKILAPDSLCTFPDR